MFADGGKCSRTLLLDGVLGDVGLADVDNAVNVERDLLAGGAPVLVSEAVAVLAVVLGREGVFARGDRLFIVLVLAGRVEDLIVNIQSQRQIPFPRRRPPPRRGVCCFPGRPCTCER